MSADLSIVVVSWNCREHLERCLASLAGEPSLEVLVVDNASTDGTGEMVRGSFPSVKFIENTDNRGFAAANNQGLALATGRHAMLLNPDTEVRPGALRTLVAYLDANPDVGAVGPRLEYPDGRLQRSATMFPTMRASLHRFTAVRYLRVFGRHYRRYKMKGFGFDQASDVDSLMGAALAVRKSVLDAVGVLDERFWMYYEEVDLCKRMRDAGHRVRFLPEATIVHAGGESSSRNLEVVRAERVKSLLRYFAKHRGRTAAAAFGLLFKAAFFVRLGIEIPLDGALWLFWRVAANRDRARTRGERLRLELAFLRRDALPFLLAGRGD